MSSSKKQKTAKTKTTTAPVKDLRPAKDPRAGAQKKEGIHSLTVSGGP